MLLALHLTINNLMNNRQMKRPGKNIDTQGYDYHRAFHVTYKKININT
jgi:hypothetical protein